MDEVEDGELYRRGSDLHSSSLHSYLQDRWVLVEAFLQHHIQATFFSFSFDKTKSEN